ncbi:MAG: DNA-protecting protein DprA [Bradyrhizobiaceae bacterium]|nr:DNA-protecting protein DprA [Bradyrhizobiaceae bacterium]
MGAKNGGVRLSDQQRIDWLRLIRAENVGPRTFRALIAEFSTAARALARVSELARRGGRSDLRIPNREEAEAELRAATRAGVRFVAIGEDEYPPLLRETDDAPPLLAVRGQLGVLARPAVALVGSRNASAAGSRFTAVLARDLGQAGFIVVSGLARGIDSASHRASLATGTVAVLAGGPDRIYPPEHVELADEIARNGATVTEMPMGWEPRARDFPRRNRIIAGMALGVVVVEAAERSGSLITARRALDAGREVFAVPGSPIDPRAAGTNRLLKEGATLVSSAGDVVEALAPIMGQAAPPLLREPAGEEPAADPAPADDTLRVRITGLLSPAPVSIDELTRAAQAPANAVQGILLELELAGRLARHRGGLVSLV